MIRLLCFACVILLAGCVTAPTPPTWETSTAAKEAEYAPFLAQGSCGLTGQAFLNKANGDTVKAAGSTVTLDPATTVGTEWWHKAGVFWVFKDQKPPSAAFEKARRSTIADADGRFRFTCLPAGNYYLRTEVTWEIAGRYQAEPWGTVYVSPSTQGGLLGQLITVQSAEQDPIILHQLIESPLPKPEPATIAHSPSGRHL
jgi:hypothetical protein